MEKQLRCMCQLRRHDGLYECDLPLGHKGEHRHIRMHIWHNCERYNCEHTGIPQYYYDPKFIETQRIAEIIDEMINKGDLVYAGEMAKAIKRKLLGEFV